MSAPKNRAGRVSGSNAKDQHLTPSSRNPEAPSRDRGPGVGPGGDGGYPYDQAGVFGHLRRQYGAKTSGTRAMAAVPSRSRKSRRSR